jgi:hypothetical protein
MVETCRFANPVDARNEHGPRPVRSGALLGRPSRQFPSARMRQNLLCIKTIFHGNRPVLVADMRNLFEQQVKAAQSLPISAGGSCSGSSLSGLAMGPSCPSRGASNLTASLPLHQSGQTLVERTTWLNQRAGGWGTEDSQ